MSNTASDAELLSRTRGGDMDAYDELYRRHLDDAAKVARIVTDDTDEAQEVVSEAFTRVLNRLKQGAGPENELAPYLKTVVRRLAIDRHRDERRSGPPADPALLDILPQPDDPMSRADDRQMVRRAFETLPARWQEVLWHTEIEGRSPAALATHLGTSPNAVAALAYRAREGLRQAYLSMNLANDVPAMCEPYAPKIPAYVRGALPVQESKSLIEHLGGCAHCRGRRDELLLLVADLRSVLWPALLLPVALGGGSAIAGGGAAAGGGLLAWLSPQRWASKGGKTLVTSAGAVAAAAIAVTALVLTSGTGEETPAAAPPPASAAPASPTPPPNNDQEEKPDDSVDRVADPPAEKPAPEEPADQRESPPPPDASPDPSPPPSPSPKPTPTGTAPAFGAHPSDVAVDAGENVTFSIDVSGTPEPTIQWQRRAEISGSRGSAVGAAATWLDVPGATSTTLRINDVGTDMDGTQYRAVATNRVETATSRSATLSVSRPPPVAVTGTISIDAPLEWRDDEKQTQCVRPKGDGVYLGECGGAQWTYPDDDTLRWSNNQCLDAIDSSPHIAAALRPCTGAESQKWRFDPQDSGRQLFVNGNSRCLDLEAGRFHHGRVIIFPCHGLPNQRFSFYRP